MEIWTTGESQSKLGDTVPRMTVSRDLRQVGNTQYRILGLRLLSRVKHNCRQTRETSKKMKLRSIPVTGSIGPRHLLAWRPGDSLPCLDWAPGYYQIRLSVACSAAKRRLRQKALLIDMVLCRGQYQGPKPSMPAVAPVLLARMGLEVSDAARLVELISFAVTRL